MRQRRPGAKQQPTHIDVKDLLVALVNALDRQIGELHEAVENARVADEYVELPERLDGSLYGGLVAFDRRNVRFDGDYSLTERLCECCEPFVSTSATPTR